MFLMKPNGAFKLILERLTQFVYVVVVLKQYSNISEFCKRKEVTSRRFVLFTEVLLLHFLHFPSFV